MFQRLIISVAVVLERRVVARAKGAYLKDAGVQSVGVGGVVKMGIGLVETAAYFADFSGIV